MSYPLEDKDRRRKTLRPRATSTNVSDPGHVQQQVATLSGILPPQGMELFQGQLERLSEDTGGALSMEVVGGILFSLGCKEHASSST
jgi:uncharacterized BrkB/YihY/UPF0761 family membrane protein